MSARERRGVRPLPARTLEGDVLTLHLVLGAALAGRTTPEHAARAARRAAQSARLAVFGPVCAVCGAPVPSRAWAIWRDAPVTVVPGSFLWAGRLYCSIRHAEASWMAHAQAWEATL